MSDQFYRRLFSATLVTLALWNPLRADDEETRLSADQRFYAALGELVDFRIKNVPLAKLPREIQRQTNLTVRIDAAAISADSRQAELRFGISADFRDMQAYELLQRLCRATDLELAVDRQQKIVLTTQDGIDADRRLEYLDDVRLLLTYDVSDLLIGYRRHHRPENSANILGDLIRSIVAPVTWKSVGGTCRLAIEGEQLIVEQTASAHEELAIVLSALRSCRRLAQSWDGQTPPPTELPLYPSSAGQAMDTILDREASLSFAGGTLRQFAAQISCDYKIEVQLDHRALEDIGLSANTKLPPFELTNTSLGAALRHMLRECDVYCLLQNDVLLLTTAVGCEGVTFSFHPVFDLCDGPEERLNLEPDDLIRLIEEVVRPTMWDVVGGLGGISYVPQTGCLAIAQTAEVMSEVTMFLSRYREMIHRYQSNPMVFVAAPISLDGDERTAVVRDRLREARVTCDFADAPLLEAVRELSRKTKLPLYISNRDLADVGLAPDVKVSAVAINAPLRETLRDMLKPLDLSFAVYDGAIVITFPEMDCGCEMVMHPTADLAHDFPQAANRSPAEIGASLAGLIQEEVQPNSWESVGAAGCVRALSNGAALIVFQQPLNQLRIEEILRDQRRSSR